MAWMAFRAVLTLLILLSISNAFQTSLFSARLHASVQQINKLESPPSAQTRVSLRRNSRAPSRLRMSGTDYVLDSFDPEEDEIVDELSNQNMLHIINGIVPDQEVNLLVWKCLGYKQIDGQWINDDVFPKWREKYPSPPDLIGVLRNYTYSMDRPVQKANQQLVATIPLKYKQGIKTHLRPLGFTGFMLDGLTPNKTRRGQCVNWLLFYREALRGKSLHQHPYTWICNDSGQGGGQLREEQEAERAAAAAPAVVGPGSRQTSGGGEGMVEQTEWKYPKKDLA